MQQVDFSNVRNILVDELKCISLQDLLNATSTDKKTREKYNDSIQVLMKRIFVEKFGTISEYEQNMSIAILGLRTKQLQDVIFSSSNHDFIDFDNFGIPFKSKSIEIKTGYIKRIIRIIGDIIIYNQRITDELLSKKTDKKYLLQDKMNICRRLDCFYNENISLMSNLKSSIKYLTVSDVYKYENEQVKITEFTANNCKFKISASINTCAMKTVLTIKKDEENLYEISFKRKIKDNYSNESEPLFGKSVDKSYRKLKCDVTQEGNDREFRFINVVLQTIVEVFERENENILEVSCWGLDSNTPEFYGFLKDNECLSNFAKCYLYKTESSEYKTQFVNKTKEGSIQPALVFLNHEEPMTWEQRFEKNRIFVKGNEPILPKY